jgi:RNA polymerase sigma-70 factor, ECF subfamily
MDPKSAAEAVFREQSGRIIATLIRLSGSFDRAEEAMQDAFTSALASWPLSGIPQNPAAWITVAAERKLIDQIRRERRQREKEPSLAYETETYSLPDTGVLDEKPMYLADDRLRLIFTCCHPALGQEAQVALTLRTLGGLTTAEIAKAFLLPEVTLAQRLVRAKQKIREAAIPYEIPPLQRLPDRLLSVQAVIYLIFNEGYTAASGRQLIRGDLCAEAIRLARVLNELLSGLSENLGLLALMLLHHSRREARVHGRHLVTLEEQDRLLWNRDEIAEGLVLVEHALQCGPLGPYQLQAAIAALHAQARTPHDTDWPQIELLYEKLLAFNSTPVVALNHAVAVAMSRGYETGLERIEALGHSRHLDRYYLFHAARADILRRLDRRTEAKHAYRQAIALVSNEVERDFLSGRLAAIGDQEAL